MAKETISLAEVREVIQSGAVFSCRFITYSASRKEGGDIKTIHECRLLTESIYMDMKGGRPLTTMERKEYALEKQAEGINDMKWGQGIRHVQIFVSGRPTLDIRPIRPILITEFNGKTVI